MTRQSSGTWSALGIAIEAEACGTPVLTVITQWLRLEWQAHRVTPIDNLSNISESLRGLHPTHVFVRVPKKGSSQPVTKRYNTAWKSARERAAQKWAERHGERAQEGFRNVRVHDLKHTSGRRLRAAGVK